FSMNLQTTISAQHAVLRGILAALEDAARRVLAGEPGGMTALRDAACSLDATFRGHLAVEESLLVPLLSVPQIDSLRREHGQQRAMLEAILAEVEHDPMELADDCLWLVRVLGNDMDAEDAGLLRAHLEGAA